MLALFRERVPFLAKKIVLVHLVAILGGVVFGVASRLPDTWLSLGLSWAAIFAFVHVAAAAEKPVRSFFLTGLGFHLTAFSWIPYTIELFGGFNSALSISLLGVYALVSSIQFALLGYLVSRFRGTKFEFGGFALAWFATEFLSPRMFPWALAHTQIPWKSFAMLAEYSGVYPLSAMLILWATLLYSRSAVGKLPRTLTLVTSLLLLGVSSYRVSALEAELKAAPAVKMGIVQGNLDAKGKGNTQLLEANLGRYRKLSAEAVQKGAELVLWPETVLNQWSPVELSQLRGTAVDPNPFSTVPMYYGVLSFERKTDVDKELENLSRRERWEKYHFRYNSAFVIDSQGQVQGMYHKRILMPFGEFMPGAKWFPSLREISPQTGNFSVGNLLDPVQLKVGEHELKMGNLICYEDLVSSLSIDAVRRGANVLINLTNDAWYGKSAAPIQHHLLASWRALENRRYLVRVTNTGYTGVVDPLGRTTASLPIFESGFLVEPVKLLEARTLYSRIGDTVNWVLSVVILLLAVFLRKETAVP